ncbi:acid protease [Auriscalpium vulgare]|uniref:Acid protease n=1 Tax=Auriscalpium vulgare TaxID=40419 RepID=A0ACB8RIY0_9AGAM|nr:acid protease [Auriscalpium vulgare]
MKTSSWSPLALTIVLGLSRSAVALRLEVRGIDARASHGRRGGIATLDNNSNVKYYVNITVGGQVFNALLDTGSSDLWVARSIPGAVATGTNASLSYAIGEVAGPVKTASLDLLGFNVPDQAFIEIDPSTSTLPDDAVIGVGPTSSSEVYSALGQKPAGDAPLDRIFRQNTSTPNSLTILLNRSDDPAEPVPGSITVGELVPGYERIVNQPTVNVTVNARKDSGEQHWQVLLDEDGVIGPDGQPINVKSAVASTSNKAQLTAVFDSGFSMPQVLPSVAEAFYSRIDGARFDKAHNFWVIPCTAELNVSFKIGGQLYPVHPLDMSTDYDGLSDAKPGECTGTFQPITYKGDPDIDMILGMAFLRNVYLLINYGDFVDGSTTRASPFVQLLSTTNDTSHADFVGVRLHGIDTTGSQPLTSAISSTQDPHFQDCFFERHKTVLLVSFEVGGALVLALVVFAIYALYKWRRTVKSANVHDLTDDLHSLYSPVLVERVKRYKNSKRYTVLDMAAES